MGLLQRLRWLFSADYRRRLEWERNPYRRLVEREPLPLDEGLIVDIPDIRASATRFLGE